MTRSHRGMRRLLIPWFIGFIFLLLLPMLTSIAMSLASVQGPLTSETPQWVGFDHYRNLIGVEQDVVIRAHDPWYWSWLGGKPTDERFYTSLYNSLVYTMLAVPFGLVFSLAMALLMNRTSRGMALVRTIVCLPYLLGGVATIIMWSWLLNPQFGWINEWIRFGYAAIDPMVRWFHAGGTTDWPVPAWLHSPTWCKPAAALIHAWTIGGSMLVFLAALRRVPTSLLEAATLDGADRWSCFRHVTWPLITPVVLLNLTVSTVFTMQSFSEAYLLGNRDQREGLLFGVLYVYELAFEPPYRLGYASALAWVLFAVVMILTVPLLLSARRWVYYAGGRMR